ncbi:hypothetical protein WJX74_008139 [Apatococcus lobatus]|uniref:Uncharacterized protein n=1 Tax=Apatococcus lobatus TaxID=904363 RepID=A0AAW1QLK3_9CHLO
MKRKREASPSRTYQFDGNAAAQLEGLGPYAVFFPNGYRPEASEPCSWKAYTHQDRQSNQVLLASTDSADFVGSTYGPESGGRAGCRHAVGVLDKATGKLQLYELEGEYPMRMEPRVPGVAYAPSTAGQDTEFDIVKRRMQNRQLVEQFGSKKSKRGMAAKEAAQVNLNMIADPLALHTSAAREAAASAAPTQDEVVKSLEEARPLPPHHLDEQTPHKAYVLKELVGELMGAIKTQEVLRAATDTAYREGDFASLRFWDYVKQRIAALALVPEGRKDEAFRARCEALALLEVLLQLYRAPPTMSADIRGDPMAALSKRCYIEANALSVLLHKFYQHRADGAKDIYTRSDSSKALLLFHCAIVALLAEGFHMPPAVFDSFRDHLRIGPQQLRTTFRELGCTVVAARLPEGGLGRAFDVKLLPPTTPPKTLRQALPPIKLPARGAPRGRK